LHRAVDISKDQSYVLFGTPPEVLERLWLPLGRLQKGTVRELAQSAGLPVFAKPDSVSVCFLPDGEAASLVAQRRPQAAQPGPIVDRSGQVLGWHRGVAGITVGQRKGLGLAAGQRRFVLEVLPERQTLVVGSRSEALRAAALIERCRWLVPTECVVGRSLLVQYTYRDPPVPATVHPLDAERAIVQFAEPQFGITPGQAAVCYADSQVLGGGWIAAKEKPEE
jgi:tRNA-specific 2-thiouridylase